MYVTLTGFQHLEGKFKDSVNKCCGNNCVIHVDLDMVLRHNNQFTDSHSTPAQHSIAHGTVYV